jgi:multiple sugar transport system ATP-binding protein
MDEPLSNLDALLRLQARAELKRLLQQVQTTTVYVTHDQIEALSMGDRIAVMENGQIIQADVPSQVYEFPTTHFVGGFIGTPPMNFMRGKVTSTNGSGAIAVGNQSIRAPLPANAPLGQDLLMGVRAENIQASTQPSADAVPAQVLVVEPLGSHLLLTVQVGDTPIKVQTRVDFPVQSDQTVYLQLDPKQLRWFDPETGLRYETT